jgi:hypothetical protein
VAATGFFATAGMMGDGIAATGVFATADMTGTGVAATGVFTTAGMADTEVASKQTERNWDQSMAKMKIFELDSL